MVLFHIHHRRGLRIHTTACWAPKLSVWFYFTSEACLLTVLEMFWIWCQRSIVSLLGWILEVIHSCKYIMNVNLGFFLWWRISFHRQAFELIPTISYNRSYIYFIWTSLGLLHFIFHFCPLTTIKWKQQRTSFLFIVINIHLKIKQRKISH